MIQVVLVSYRTQVLFPSSKLSFSSFLHMIKIAWATNFIHCIAPSTVFGDLFRIKELMKTENGASKDDSVYVSIFSKMFSFLALVAISFLANLALFKFNKELRIVFYFSAIIFASALILFLYSKHFKPLVLPVFNKLYKLSSNEFFYKRLDNFKIYITYLINNKRVTLSAFFSSFMIQVLNTLSFIAIIYTFSPQIAEKPLLFIVLVPIGIFIMTLPISFSGLGVGHLAFAQLLRIAGVNNGADVFTIYFAFSFIFNLLGFFPFLSIWRS
jgi:uncharacterized membrane protein YbhN (UPF0104 family)